MLTDIKFIEFKKIKVTLTFMEKRLPNKQSKFHYGV